jgi:hypothetical protein
MAFTERLSETLLWPNSLKKVAAKPVRDFLSENPALADAVHAAVPWLAEITDGLRSHLPLPLTVRPFVEPPFFRPAGSHRCTFLLFSDAVPNTLNKTSNSGLAIKGMEPAVPDFETLLQDLRGACYSPHNIAEHFVFEEQKIPGCVSLPEAMREAECASAIQSAHLRAYGDLARLPIPLFVYRHSDEVQHMVAQSLRRSLSQAAFLAIQPQLTAGLGVYVYYYPAPPTRVRDVDFLLDGLDFRARVIALTTRVCNPDDLIRQWVRGFVRMLFLGYLPGSLASFRTGVCCQPQNACMDGGFVDLDSLQFSVDSLLRTVRTLIAGSGDPTRAEGPDVRVDLHYLRQYVFFLIEEAIVSEGREALGLDSRIRGFFTPARSAADLVDRLATYYSPTTGCESATREAGAFGLSLLLSTHENSITAGEMTCHPTI